MTSSKTAAQAASGWSRLVVLALCAVLGVASGQPAAAAGWEPGLGQRLDLQLTAEPVGQPAAIAHAAFGTARLP